MTGLTKAQRTLIRRAAGLTKKQAKRIDHVSHVPGEVIAELCVGFSVEMPAAEAEKLHARFIKAGEQA